MVDDPFDTAMTLALDAGVDFRTAFEMACLLSWRGADEPVQIATAATVRCGCGVAFRFRKSATRAKCPRCGARWERQNDDHKPNQFA